MGRAILHFAEQMISSGRRGWAVLPTDGQGFRPTERYVMHALKPETEIDVFIYTDTLFHTRRAVFSSWYLYINVDPKQSNPSS